VSGRQCCRRTQVFINLEDNPSYLRECIGDSIGYCIGDPCFFCSPHIVWATEETWISNTFSKNCNLLSRYDTEGIYPFAQVVEGMDVVDSLNKQYGTSINETEAWLEGSSYLNQFPKLDYIKAVSVCDTLGECKKIQQTEGTIST
jgi:hypothetical protein